MNITLSDGGKMGVPVEVAHQFLMGGARLPEIPARNPQKVPRNRRVRVLAVVHGWFPGLAAGSERMMQHLLDALPQDEFDVHILSFGVQEEPLTVTQMEYEGTPVTIGTTPPIEPDLIITHHGIAARVVPTYYDLFPHAHVIAVYHNERYDIPDINRLNADLNVFNTKWVKDEIGKPGIVVHPPLEPERHWVDYRLGQGVTLVNLQDNKGVEVFREVARRFSDRPFLGVEGTHGEQQLTGYTDNVAIWHPQQDMRLVWMASKVILMPSEYESYGMVAAEACCNGIPVIANPTPGLVECLDWAGLFVPRNDVDGYERVLRQLLTDEKFYGEWSAKALLRGEELAAQTRRELNKFVTRIRKLVR